MSGWTCASIWQHLWKLTLKQWDCTFWAVVHTCSTNRRSKYEPWAPRLDYAKQVRCQKIVQGHKKPFWSSFSHKSEKISFWVGAEKVALEDTGNIWKDSSKVISGPSKHTFSPVSSWMSCTRAISCPKRVRRSSVLDSMLPFCADASLVAYDVSLDVPRFCGVEDLEQIVWRQLTWTYDMMMVYSGLRRNNPLNLLSLWEQNPQPAFRKVDVESAIRCMGRIYQLRAQSKKRMIEKTYIFTQNALQN